MSSQLDFNQSFKLLMEGNRGLSKDEVKLLSRNLKSNPNDLRSRIMLLGHFSSKKSWSRFLPHLIWMIDNCPQDLLHRHLPTELKGDAFDKAKAHWNLQVKCYPKDAVISFHAGSFCIPNCLEDAAKLIKRASTLDLETDEFPRSLSHVYLLMSLRSPHSQSKTFAQKSATQMKAAVERFSEPSSNDSYFLPYFDLEVAQIADLSMRNNLIQEAEELANILLNKKSIYLRRLGTNVASVVQDELATNLGHLILGWVASSKGRLKMAKDHLSKIRDQEINVNLEQLLEEHGDLPNWFLRTFATVWSRR